MTILNNSESNITADLPEAEKQLGVDIQLTSADDLELNNLQDFSLVAGASNASQAAGIKLKTESKGNRLHPLIGVDLPIGDKTVTAVGLRFSIIRSLRQDPRFTGVDVSVQIDGNVYFININLTVLNVDISIPLQFVAQN